VHAAPQLSDAALRALLAAKAPGGGGLRAVAADAALRCAVQQRSDGDGLAGVLATASGPSRLILADCTARRAPPAHAAPRAPDAPCAAAPRSDTTALHLRALAAGAAVATANKVPMTCALPLYRQLTAAPRRLRAESTVGAGLPVHAALARVVAAGDPVSRIAGAFSGTLGYVMSGARAGAGCCRLGGGASSRARTALGPPSGLEEGRPFSEVVAAAKAEGYTEPDPRDDLSGLDVARKARAARRRRAADTRG
jgi:hypothetical protein